MVQYLLKPKDAIAESKRASTPLANILGSNSTPINYTNGYNIRTEDTPMAKQGSILSTMLYKIFSIPSIMVYQANTCKSK